MTEKKPRPRARARKLVPSPPPPERQPHPVFWVECFGCGEKVRQILDPLGKASLPDGWMTLFVTDRESKINTPDVYASSGCGNRAAQRLSSKYNSERITIVGEGRLYKAIQESRGSGEE